MDPTIVPAAYLSPTPWDAATKAQLIALAGSLPDEKAKDVADVSDATPYGKRLMQQRYAIGAAAGFAVGLLVAKALSRR